MASIYKRPDGRWCGQVNRKGTRKSFYGKTKKEVETKIREYKNDIDNFGVEIKDTSVTVSEWLYKHLFTNVYPNVTNGTFDRYMGLYNANIKNDELGKVFLSDVKHLHLQTWFNNKKDTSKKSLSMIRYLLRQSFDFAINNNLLRINPAANIKLPNSDVEKKEIEVLTIEEQEKYMNVLPSTKHSLFFLLALFSGMRLGELIALKWDNVDLKSCIINVRESYRRTRKYNDDGTSKNIIDKKKPKTPHSNRHIPIPPFVNKLLKEHKLQSQSNYVFATRNNTHMTAENIRRIQIQLCKKANIRYISFHGLRHTYATRLIENGTDIKTVSELLGHSDITLTLNTYVHPTNNVKVSAVNSLENQFVYKVQ